jgi:hypothetical protein
VTHDLHLAASADRVAHLSEGRIDRVVRLGEHSEAELRQRLGLPEATGLAGGPREGEARGGRSDG